ncbi:MAG: RlmE family RNA methyltransferase [Hyphomicrobium aestuarii]|nr:RlmE family RNA methyltransferase [Hyphomicrobium aestuarii]
MKKPSGTSKSGSSGVGGGARGLRVNVKTAGKRTVSSARWLERQLNDPYVAASKREGYRSRAAYKLIELDDKYKLLKPGQRIVDLGAAPGGWSQVAAARVRSIDGTGGQRGLVVAIDIDPMEALAGVDVLHLDFLAPHAEDTLKQRLGGAKAHGVFTDMAAPTVGHSRTDHLRIMGLAEAAGLFAVDVLEPGGFFLAKVFQGGSEKTLLEILKRHFRSVRHVKPPASRSDSAELYVLATGFRIAPGAAAVDETDADD